MTTLPIIQIGHPTLRQRAREVTAAELDSPELHRICDDLVATMRAANGTGVAAPQVDIPLRLFPDRVEDPTTLCAWDMFRAYRQDAWVESIQSLLAHFPGEPVAGRGCYGREEARSSAST